MLNRVLSMALSAVLGQVIKQRVRTGSIHAVKNYIQLVKLARMATLGLVGLSVAAAILVAGIMLVVVGIVGLLPIDPNTVAIILLSTGAVLTLVALAGFGFAFSEKRWLEVSKAYELMDAALAPWDGMLPPNPLDILKGKSHAASPENTAENIAENTAEKTAEKIAQETAAETRSAPLESRLLSLEELAGSLAESKELAAKKAVESTLKKSKVVLPPAKNDSERSIRKNYSPTEFAPV